MLQSVHLLTRYTQAVERFTALNNIYHPTNTRSPSILSERVKHVGILLEYLKNPEKNFRIIHVTGTSGKGTVVSVLQNTIRASGQRVGALVSPHTTTFLERFLLNDGLIPCKTFIEGIEEVEFAYGQYLQKHPPIAFTSLATVLGLHVFAKEKVEWAIIEASCGGRHDSTNAIAHTEASVITNIDKDHTELLGNTLEEIAFEKAGIIKPHGLAIVGEERSRLKKVFMDEAIQKEAALFFAHKRIPEFESATRPAHVNHNIRVAAITAHELGFEKEIIKKGLETYSTLPCRFETISKKPHVILDGAHNTAKIEATIEHIKGLKKKPVILFGTGSNKEAALMLRKLYPHATKIYTTRTTMAHKKAENPATLLKLVPSAKRGSATLDPHTALEIATKSLHANETLLVTGSLYLAGELRTKWHSEAKIVQQGTSSPI